jgi:hypothetical protein
MMKKITFQTTSQTTRHYELLVPDDDPRVAESEGNVYFMDGDEFEAFTMGSDCDVDDGEEAIVRGSLHVMDAPQRKRKPKRMVK